MKRTDIEWTDLSANPLKYRETATGRVVWGCVKKSAGCANCYAEAIAKHYDRGGPFTKATMKGLTPFLDEKDLRQILTAKTIDKRPVAGSKCFLGDMTDVFGEWVPDELLDRLFAVMALRGDVTFQVLTKRADRMAAYMQRLGRSIKPLEEAARAMGYTFKFRGVDDKEYSTLPFPLPNLWLGTSVENQAAADERIPHLLATPAAVRFLSCEPLLGPLFIQPHFYEPDREARAARISRRGDRVTGDGRDVPPGVDWVIIGGESGPGSRPFAIEWARSLVSQCKAAGVACFVKQLGAVIHATNAIDPLDQFPCPSGSPRYTKQGPGEDTIELGLIDRKGGDPAEWPEDLRVREFPKVAA